MLDSKKRFYIINNLFGLIPKIENFYYSLPSGLLGYIGADWVITCCDNIKAIMSMSAMYRYFYENREEYCPTFGLTNFEIK